MIFVGNNGLRDSEQNCVHGWQRLAGIQELKFIYHIRSHTSYSKLGHGTDQSFLENRRKGCRAKLFCRALKTGVIKNTMKAPNKKHNPKQLHLSHISIQVLGESETWFYCFSFFSISLKKTATLVTFCHKINNHFIL